MNKILTAAVLLISTFVFSQGIEISLPGGSSSTLEGVLQNYIRIPSESGREKEAGDYLKAVCEANRLHIREFGSEDGKYNFAASLFPLSSGKPNIIFLNHIDVVPEDEDADAPYSGTIREGKIFGRGAVDNKGAAMVQLHAMLEILQREDYSQSRYNVTFLAVSCEESQCPGGIGYVIEHYFEELNPVVVFGEGPTELTAIIEGDFLQPIFGISVAHKRAYWLELELEVSSNGHGSITPLDYGNKQMVEALNNLTRKKQKAIFTELNTKFLKDMSRYRSGMEKFFLKHPRLFKPLLVPQLRKQPELFSLFSNTITLTNVFTNSNAVNKIPSKTGAYLDCRLLPGTDEEEFKELIRKRLKNDEIRVTVIESLPRTKPSKTDNIYYRSLRAAILEKYPTATTMTLMMPNINDLGAFRAKGVPAYGNFPIYLSKEEAESIHGLNEHIRLQSLYDGAQVYYIFLKNMIRQQQQ